MADRPFFAALLHELNKRIGDNWTIKRIVYRPEQDAVDLRGIDKRTVLILWGDERSRYFPKEYVRAAGVTIKCYCPESWEAHGIIPVTDIAMNWDGDGDPRNLIPCSKRPHTVFFSGNLNNRRTDLYRGLCGQSFGYPLQVSACSPVTGKYPLWQRAEAVLMNRVVRMRSNERVFSHLYPNSLIQFNDGFCKGSLSSTEYLSRIRKTKIVWCAPGFMTNETSRLIEASCAGNVVMVGKLPNNDLYRGNPFVLVDDWRKIQKMTDELLKDESRLDELGVAARKWYETHFSPTAQASRIAGIIQKRLLVF